MKAMLLSIPLFLAACQGATPSDSSAATLTQSARTAPAAISESRRTAITQAVARVAPAVVTVQTEIVERVASDPFDFFFGRRSGDRVGAGIGSGFITRSDGVIVTNAHVVAGATKVSVAMRDGTTYPAQVLGQPDETNDLAVLKIDAKNLPVAPLGNSTSLAIGEWAIAIGNPYGFVLGNPEPSVTVGVISATGRNLVGSVEGGGVYVDMIQTDASINPGNSGGPLVDSDGEVIGVNSSIYTPSGGSVGLGFAFPINRAKRVVEDLVAHGKVRRPWIGAQIDIPRTRNPRDLIGAGVVVRSVAPGSPAARAGVQPGDRLLQSRGRTLRNVYDWEAEQLDLRVGETIPVIVRRGGRDLSLSVEVADQPEVSAPKVAVLRELELVTLTPAIRAERSIRAARGALVFSASQRISDEIGLQSGDVIVQINRNEVTSAADVQRIFDAYAGRSAMRVFFERAGQVYNVDIVIQ